MWLSGGWGWGDWPQKWSTTQTTWPRSKSRCCCWGSVSQHRPGPCPEFPSYCLCTCRWVYTAVTMLCITVQGVRFKDCFSVPSYFFCTSSAKQKRPEFTLNLEHMKILQCTRFSMTDLFIFFIQQANNENISTQLGKDVFSLEDSITYISFLVAAVLQVRILTCKVC